MQKQFAVIATEPISKIIASAPVLRHPVDWLEFVRERIKPKIAIANIDLRTGRDAANHSAQQSIRAVNPIIQSDAKTVQPRLVIFRREAAENLLHLVGL